MAKYSAYFCEKNVFYGLKLRGNQPYIYLKSYRPLYLKKP